MDFFSAELDLSRVVVIVGDGNARSTFVVDGNTSLKDTFDLINKRAVQLNRVLHFSVHVDRSKEPEFLQSLSSATASEDGFGSTQQAT